MKNQKNGDNATTITFNSTSSEHLHSTPKTTEGKIWNAYNSHQRERNYQVNDQPSMAVPDQTMSLRTIVERYANGLPITGNMNQPLYDDLDNQKGINPLSLDLVDLHEMKTANEEWIKAYNKDLSDSQREKINKSNAKKEEQIRLQAIADYKSNNPV